MANLLDLPNEIISKILSIVASTCPKFWLRSILISSRRLSLILRPLIIKRVRFCLDSNRHLAKCALFMLNLDENPELRGMVHSLALFWKYENHEDEDVREKAKLILENLPGLKSLSIRAGTDDYSNRHLYSFSPQFLEVNPMPDLREIEISGGRLTIENMQKYMVLSHAEHITIRSELTGSPSKLEVITKRTSPVLTLALDLWNHIRPQDLRDVLKLCPRIERLRCGLPRFSVTTSCRSSRIVTPLRPIELSKALASARDSLREFEFQVCACGQLDQVDSRLDLSMMRVLKSISCPAECFFSPSPVYFTRTGLYELLPASLEELTLQFNLKQNLVSRYGASDNSEELIWLVELARLKSEYTPRLKRVHLIDWNNDYDDFFDWRLWPGICWPPRSVVDSMTDADIGLRISIWSRGRYRTAWTNVEGAFKEPSRIHSSGYLWHSECPFLPISIPPLF